MKKIALSVIGCCILCVICNGQFNKILDFSNAVNGKNPNGSLISDGTFLYGMNVSEGINGCGVIFKIMPDGTGHINIHDFGSGQDGKNPYGTLVSDGTFLYGMTSAGGVNNNGMIFKRTYPF